MGDTTTYTRLSRILPTSAGSAGLIGSAPMRATNPPR